jgi:hypothetical protein
VIKNTANNVFDQLFRYKLNIAISYAENPDMHLLLDQKNKEDILGITTNMLKKQVPQKPR